MDCSIILVNYKTAKLLAECLQTVYAQTTRINFEVIVVDNDSQDGSRELITSQFPQVKWIQLNYNAGFARGNNAGIRTSSASTVLLLNTDTVILNNAIEQCCLSLLQSKYVAAGVQLLNPDGSPQISGNYVMRGALNNLLPLPYVGNFLKGVAKLFKVAKPNLPDSNDTVEVDWINGAFQMVKRSAIEQAGMMDEDFFLYAEEAEWCSRLKKVGPLCIFGKQKVIHLQGESANAAFGSQGKGYFNLYDRKGWQNMLSNFVRLRKQLGVGWFLFHLFIYCFTVPVFAPALLIDKLFNGKRSLFTWKHLKGYTGNIAKLLGITPTIIANKPYFYKVI